MEQHTPNQPNGMFSATVLSNTGGPEHAPLLAWFFQHCTYMAQEGLEEWLAMPYEQGGGQFILAQLHNRPEAPAWAEPTLRMYEDATTGPEQTMYDEHLVPDELGALEATGWVFLDAYTDSMTSMYASAVFKAEDGTYTIHDI